MTLSALLLQARPPQSILDMVLGGTLPTKIVLLVLCSGSVYAWWLIFHKWKQFREVREQGDQFLEHMEQAQRLEDAYKAILALPESPYGRVFRQGVNLVNSGQVLSVRAGHPRKGFRLHNWKRSGWYLRKKRLKRGMSWRTVLGL